MIKKIGIIMMATMAVACGGGAEAPQADNRYALTPAEKEAGMVDVDPREKKVETNPRSS